jgi:hypothetical protein
MKGNLTLAKDFADKRNDYCLCKFLAYATEVFSDNEQSHLVEKQCFSKEFLVKGYVSEILEELRMYSEAYKDGTTYFAPYTAIVQASMMGKSRCV